MAFYISSPAFHDGDRIPAKYTCEGKDISPPIIWNDPPIGTESFAVLFEDPEDTTAPGGVFTHWILFNIPSNIRQLPEGVPNRAKLTNGALQGKNDFKTIGYGGPCPDGTGPHLYRFTLYALNCSLDLKAGASKKELLDSIHGHILAQSEFTGIY